MSTKRSWRMLRDSTKTIGRTWRIPLGEPRSSATTERDRTGRVTSRKERCGVAGLRFERIQTYVEIPAKMYFSVGHTWLSHLFRPDEKKRWNVVGKDKA